MRTKAHGIRILAKAQGTVSEWSLISIVLQISSAIGLLLAAKTLTDLVMLSAFREKNHYSNMKYLRTEMLWINCYTYSIPNYSYFIAVIVPFNQLLVCSCLIYVLRDFHLCVVYFLMDSHHRIPPSYHELSYFYRICFSFNLLELCSGWLPQNVFPWLPVIIWPSESLGHLHYVPIESKYFLIVRGLVGPL